MAKKKKKKKGSIVLNIFIAAAFLVGAGIFLYPTVSDMWNQYRNAQLISTYDQAVTDLSDDNYEKLWKEAEEYNAEHPVNSIVDAFNEEEDYEPTHPYDEVLDPNGDGLMGSIEIPKIQAKLAIYHGLSKKLEENPQKLEDALKVMEILSSVEGTTAIYDESKLKSLFLNVIGLSGQSKSHGKAPIISVTIGALHT